MGLSTVHDEDLTAYTLSLLSLPSPSTGDLAKYIVSDNETTVTTPKFSYCIGPYA